MMLMQNQDVTSIRFAPRVTMPIQTIVSAISAWTSIMNATSAPIT